MGGEGVEQPIPATSCLPLASEAFEWKKRKKDYRFAFLDVGHFNLLNWTFSLVKSIHLS